MFRTLTQFKRNSSQLAALAACLIAGTAFAGGTDAAPSVAVRYGDLNLSTDKGLDTFYARVAYAARQVCAADGLDIRNLREYSNERACESQAIARALHTVQAPKVAASSPARRERS